MTDFSPTGKTRIWTSPTTGQVFQLKPISSALAGLLSSDPTGKPAIPSTRVDYGGGNSGLEPNANDPVYLEQLNAWRNANNHRSMVYAIGTGVDIEVPQDFTDTQLRFWPNASVDELRYFYVTSLVPIAELETLVNAIMGITMPTEDGIAVASATFPGNS